MRKLMTPGTSSSYRAMGTPSSDTIDNQAFFCWLGVQWTTRGFTDADGFRLAEAAITYLITSP